MSENSSMKERENKTDGTDASNTIVITVDVDRANAILRLFEVPMPDASGIDEIRLIVK